MESIYTILNIYDEMDGACEKCGEIAKLARPRKEKPQKC